MLLVDSNLTPGKTGYLTCITADHLAQLGAEKLFDLIMVTHLVNDVTRKETK